MYGDAYERIESLVRTPTPVRAGMYDLLDLCAKQLPSKLWSHFRELDFESDQTNLTDWLRRLLETEPPPSTIKGFWFGLFNPIIDGEPTCRLYFSGSERFDPDNSDDPDWPCGPEYFPEGRYSSSDILATIYREAWEAEDVAEGAEGEVGSLAEYVLCLGYSCLVIADWCRGPLRHKLLGGVPFRGVAAGFDNGDLMMIDILRPE